MYDIAALKDHIIGNYPNESCGFILEDDSLVFCNNISETPEKHFKIAPKEFVGYAGKIKYIFHSHCVDSRRASIFDARTPSLKDMEGQIASGVSWLIFATEGWVLTEPVEIPRIPSQNYIDRPFIWFVNDCYTLVQDYYKFELGIELKDYVLHDYTQVRKTDNIFDEFITEYGFTDVKDLNDLQNGDLFIVDNSGFRDNHLGIYHNGKMLHQGLLSCEEPFEKYLGGIKRRLKYVG